MPSPTIRDVAREAGVGIGTVSRVLNGSPHVSAATRERILAVVERLGYQPNVAARQLSGGKTYTIGVLTPFFTKPSYVQRLSGIQAALHQSNYDLVLYSIETAEQLHRRLPQLFSQRRIDGLLSISLHIDAYLSDLKALPIVSIDDSLSTISHTVRIDNRNGGLLATQFLIEHGHQQIGFVGDLLEYEFGFPTTRDRFEGYCQALETKALSVNTKWHSFGDHSEAVAREQALEILQQNHRPTAIFASADTKALGVLAAARELNLRVPQDIAVIGFDDITVARYAGLTTVNQSLYDSGFIGAQKMLTLLGGQPDDHPQHVDLPLKIIKRHTV
jgi:DNA-binding LacI/PurR family transcriptional regulator